MIRWVVVFAGCLGPPLLVGRVLFAQPTISPQLPAPPVPASSFEWAYSISATVMTLLFAFILTKTVMRQMDTLDAHGENVKSLSQAVQAVSQSLETMRGGIREAHEEMYRLVRESRDATEGFGAVQAQLVESSLSQAAEVQKLAARNIELLNLARERGWEPPVVGVRSGGARKGD